MTHHNGKPWRQPAFNPGKQASRIAPLLRSTVDRSPHISTDTDSFELAFLALVMARQKIALEAPRLDPGRLQLRTRSGWWRSSGWRKSPATAHPEMAVPGKVLLWCICWGSRKDPSTPKATDKILFVDWATLRLVE